MSSEFTNVKSFSKLTPDDLEEGSSKRKNKQTNVYEANPQNTFKSPFKSNLATLVISKILRATQTNS